MQQDRDKEERQTMYSPLLSEDDPKRNKKQPDGNLFYIIFRWFIRFCRGVRNFCQSLLCWVPGFNFVRPKKKVQILDSIHTNASARFATTLMYTLNDFDCLIKKKGERLEIEIPLIVVCPRSTRLQPDIELALENMTYTEKCVVLIVHTGAETNLPAISSSTKLSGFPGNIEIFDIGFDSDYGEIYRCQQNDKTLGYLREYINRFD